MSASKGHFVVRLLSFMMERKMKILQKDCIAKITAFPLHKESKNLLINNTMQLAAAVPISQCEKFIEVKP